MGHTINGNRNIEIIIIIIFVILGIQLKQPLHVSQGVFLCYQKGAEPLQFECSCFIYSAFSLSVCVCVCVSTEPVQVNEMQL